MSDSEQQEKIQFWKSYYLKHKESQLKYQAKHRDSILAKKRVHHHANKTKTRCETCDCELYTRSLNAHSKTKKHKDAILAKLACQSASIEAPSLVVE